MWGVPIRKVYSGKVKYYCLDLGLPFKKSFSKAKLSTLSLI